MRAFSSILIAELRKEVFAVFWMMELNFSTVQRFIDIDIDIHYGGNRYFSYPFKVGDVTYTANMAIDSITLEIANTDLSMSALLLGSDITGSEATVSFGCLNSNYQVLGVKDLFYGKVSGWKILRDKSVEITIVNEFMLWRKKTLRIAQASCPWPFKGTLSNGLVGYWPFNEGSGTVAHDKTQNGNDGTLINMEDADWVDGVSGKALDFDGINEYVNCGDGIDFADAQFSSGFSISMWVKPGVIPADKEALFSSAAGIPGAEWQLYIFWDTDGKLGADQRYGGTQNTYKGDVHTADELYHIVVAWDGITSRLYINGIYENGAAMEQPDQQPANREIRIGSFKNWANVEFTGLIDEVRIYSRALTQDEITFLYNNPAPDECHYGGAQTWCDQTYERCKVLTNKDNFGGFRFLPYIMEKEIWWGGPNTTD